MFPGLHDSQVQYWGLKIGGNANYEKNDTVLYLDTNMDAGHGGASGRFEAQIGKRIYFFIGFRIDYKIVVVY
jgi:protease II